MSRKKLYVTLDTEMDCDIRWGRPWPATYSSIAEGIPNILRPVWDKYRVHPIYFVSPEVLYLTENCEILRSEIEKGAQIGAHLHLEYIDPDGTWDERVAEIAPQFPNSAISDENEYEKIKNLSQLISDKLGVEPVWYRAARFGMDEMTIKSLSRLGFQYDSSVTPGINWSSKGGPDYRKFPLDPYDIGEGIKEFPVTILGKRFGVFGRFLPDNWMFYRWLRPTVMTYTELKSVIKEVNAEGATPVMMFHTTEVAVNKSPYVRNNKMLKYFVWRLEKSIEYAKSLGFAV